MYLSITKNHINTRNNTIEIFAIYFFILVLNEISKIISDGNNEKKPHNINDSYKTLKLYNITGYLLIIISWKERVI